MASLISTVSINMMNPDVWYGYVSSYGSTHITLVDGNVMGTYYGSFSYDSYGNVYGTLTGFKTWVGGTLTLTVKGANVNAFDYYSAVQGGNGVLAVNIAFSGADLIKGSDFDDSLIGCDGNDSIDGGAGSDVILGGNDADGLSGSAGADSIYGDSGKDKIFGGSGADYLNGGNGADTLTGGSGRDVLNGGFDIAVDIFDFNLVSESVVGTRADRIERFGHGVDKIDLSGIDANSTNAANNTFTFTVTSARAHSVWYAVQSEGIIVRGDVDGNRIADFEIFIANESSISAGDFVL